MTARALLPVLGSALLAALVGCGDDPSPAAANLSWQFQCVTAINCTPQRYREVVGFDGERGNLVQCSGIDDAFGNVNLRFRAENLPGDFGIEVRNVTVNRESLAITASAGCTTNVWEQNQFQGNCGAMIPREEQPCQLDFVEVGGGRVSGFLRCDGIPLRTSNAVQGRVLADEVVYTPGDPINGQGLSFAFQNCDGV